MSVGFRSRTAGLSESPGLTRRDILPAANEPICLQFVVQYDSFTRCPCFVAIVLLAGWILPYELLGVGATDSWSVAQRASLDGCWPTLMFVTMLSTLLAIACYRRQVRFAATPSERIAWPIFVFLGGLPAWVAYRYGRHWPVLERCLSAGTHSRDCETCAACRQEFPLPERQGFEILAV